MAAQNTAPKERRVIGRPFSKGRSGNPAGRPKGSRNRLSEDVLRARAVLQEVLTARSSVIYRGFYAETAEELRQLGLDSAAEIVEEADQLAPHVWELPHRLPKECHGLIKDHEERMRALREAYEASTEDSSTRINPRIIQSSD